MKMDPKQSEAITTEAKRVLVVAGPGSGKTRVICGRIGHLIDAIKLLPSSVACITFTRYAAEEIRKRITARAVPGFVGTLHAFCLNLIMKVGHHLGYEQEWITILDDQEASLDEREVLADRGLIKKGEAGKITWKKAKAKEWEAYKEGVLAGAVEMNSNPMLADALMAFIGRLRIQNTLTFGTMMWEALHLLEDARARGWARGMWQHFLIDEFQDTDHAQWKVVHRIIEKLEPATLFCVGDSDQSIYQWRYADPSIMLSMAQDPAVQVIKLDHCYRFGPVIHAPAYGMIKKNSNRIEHEPKPMGLSTTFEVLAQAQPRHVAQLVRELLDQYAPKDICIISRNHWPLELMQKHLASLKIPCTKLGRLNRLKAKAEFRACLCLLRLSYNPGSRISFQGVTATMGITEEDLLGIRRVMLESRCHSWQAMKDVKGITVDPPGTVQELRAFVSLWDPHGDYSEALEFIATVAYAIGFQTTQDLVNHLVMMGAQDELLVADQADAVALATGHAAKGLEWKVVLVIGMNQGLFPSHQSLKAGRMEEERRLAFVAFTRAKEKLYLIHTDFSQEDAESEWGLKMMWDKTDPSQFIEECTGHLMCVD